MKKGLSSKLGQLKRENQAISEPFPDTYKNKSNFLITKAVNIDNLAEVAQKRQKSKLLKGILTDDKYIAENYYKGYSDNDSILHERDGLISKMKQFDYRVHKLIKKGDKDEIQVF